MQPLFFNCKISAMLTSQQCQTKYGTPGAEIKRKFFTFWDIPDDINAKIKALPNLVR